jgi:hypothetical protein
LKDNGKNRGVLFCFFKNRCVCVPATNVGLKAAAWQHWVKALQLKPIGFVTSKLCLWAHCLCSSMSSPVKWGSIGLPDKTQHAQLTLNFRETRAHFLG